MNPVQRKSQLIGTQLKALPTTAKMLIFALMVILTLSLFLVAQFAGRPSMVPLPLDLDADGRTKVLSFLERSGIAHRERGGRLMVPAEQKYTVLAKLAERDVISTSDVDFSTIMGDTSPFLTREQNRKRWLITKMNVLSMLITQFSGIERATVVIDQPDTGGFGRTHLSPTASVTVIPRGEGLSTATIGAIASLVAGAQPGLKVSDVRVIDAKSGTSYTPRDEENLSASKHLEVKQATERDVKATIVELLAPIPGVRVAVNAQVDTREIEQRLDSYQEALVGPLSQSRRSMESTSQSRSAEPGVRPNTGAAIAAAGASGTHVTDESSRETTKPVFPSDARLITDHTGYALKINVSILVPRSYFVALFRRNQNDADVVPDVAQLEPVVTSETARIKAMVVPLIDTAAYPEAQPGTVVVSMIPDMAVMAGVAPMPGVPPVGPMGSSGELVTGTMSTDLLKYILLAGLSLLSLAMMYLMVRRAGAPSQLPTTQEIVGVPPALPTDQSEVVGEAEESAPAMEGLELDDDTLRHKQRLGQISDMVKQNPDEVADLLRRWVSVEA